MSNCDISYIGKILEKVEITWYTQLTIVGHIFFAAEFRIKRILLKSKCFSFQAFYWLFVFSFCFSAYLHKYFDSSSDHTNTSLFLLTYVLIIT